MKLSIIYVNYNTTSLLLDSIRSLADLGLEHEVIVVDNASKSFDPGEVTSVRPDAKVIVSNENLGFGRGNNLGAEAANGEYLWILNTDTILPPDHRIGDVLSFLDAHPEYAAALPLLTDRDGTVQPTQVAYFPTAAKTLLNIPVRVFAKVLPFLAPLYSRVNADFRPTRSRDVEVAVAAAFIVRDSAFKEVGGFSPEFFFFYEDSDLCRKLKEAGYRIRFFTEAHMIHLWGASISGKRSVYRRKKLYFQGQDIYLKKWHSPVAHAAIKILRLPLVLRYRLLDR